MNAKVLHMYYVCILILDLTSNKPLKHDDILQYLVGGRQDRQVAVDDGDVSNCLRCDFDKIPEKDEMVLV